MSLKKAEGLADAVSALSGQLRRNLDENLDAVGKARAACNNYAPAVRCNGQACFQNVDLGRFCIELAKASKNVAVVQAAENVVRGLQTMVVANYPGPDGGDKFGSRTRHLLPSDRSTYLKDDIRKDGYVKENKDNPVEFVQDHEWADFLKALITARLKTPKASDTPDEPAKLELLNSTLPVAWRILKWPGIHCW